MPSAHNCAGVFPARLSGCCAIAVILASRPERSVRRARIVTASAGESRSGHSEPGEFVAPGVDADTGRPEFGLVSYRLSDRGRREHRRRVRCPPARPARRTRGVGADPHSSSRCSANSTTSRGETSPPGSQRRDRSCPDHRTSSPTRPS
jgi:hypothetical protein